ncbi:MAG: zinc ribbon domain-containing protein [Deltaproteobacteria bacterium]|nr:zinc ribbon domain-containing protein [Deltaproteobacteria bacterium]
MAVCPHCSREIEDASRFCRYCGGEIHTPLPRPDKPPESPPPSPLLQPGEYLKTGWRLFRQFPGGFVVFTLVYLVILAVISHPRGIGWLAATAIHEPLTAGVIIVAAKLLQDKNPRFRDFFGGFQFRYFLPLVLLGLISRILITIGLILLIAPGVYLMVSYIFATPLLVDRGLDFWPALEESRRFVTPRWFSFFGFILLLLLVNLAGILALGVGLLVSIPVSWCAVMAAYADIMGLQSDY